VVEGVLVVNEAACQCVAGTLSQSELVLYCSVSLCSIVTASSRCSGSSSSSSSSSSSGGGGGATGAKEL